jgi:peptidoglycan DL-endopeptidase CwlO|uniref:NlpC/P60 family protein n=1 Tax=Candidatus Planktophila sp. TaxID=2175601 RepID=UPI004048FE37
MFRFLIALALIVGLSPGVAQARPTVETAQWEVDRLRTLAAEKYEDANEATIRIKELERETGVLESREVLLRAELDAASTTLSRIAIAQYTAGGFGEGLNLLFSSDPTKYLSDAGTMDLLARNYSKQLRNYATTKQKVEASQFVVADKTALLRAERERLNKQVASAKASLARAEKILKGLKKEDRERLAREEAAREKRILSTSKKLAQNFKGDNSRGSIALKYALQQVGDVYVWAAAGPTRWDCSGLTMRAFAQAKVSLPHSSRVQIRYGKSVSSRELKPGDLLFFGQPISHVSIYMGKGKMVHAPRPGKRVEVINFTTRFGSKPFVGARRI